MLDTSRLNAIRGWFNQDEAEWLYGYALGCHRCLEIGAWQGKSTYALLSAVNSTPGDNKLVISVDPYQPLTEPKLYYSELQTPEGRQRIIDRFKYNIAGFEDVVTHELIELPSVEAYPFLHYRNLPPFDLAFIDADHSELAVTQDILGCLSLLRPGGKVCGHDYRAKGNYEVKRIVDKLLPNRKLGAGSCWGWQLPDT